MITNFYKEQETFYLAIDCIILGFDNEKLRLLLIKRNFEPHQGEWSLMGGFLRKKESLDDAAQRILTKLTGLQNVFLEQLYTYGEVHRDPGQRVISVAYYSLIHQERYKEEVGQRHNARWFDFDKVPKLVFDHNQMVEKAHKRLMRRSKTQPIGFELLPEKFTIPQLQNLYEAINLQKYDKRNFRKKILSMNVLQKLDEKDKENSRRGAYLYQFDKEKYDYLLSKGYHFEI
ncbi:MAG: NUDIX hydrolase [Bacteroidota bacterium]